MQWGFARGAGFTKGEPWLPISPDHRVVNVDAQRDDPRSMLTLYQRLIALRRAEPALEVGRFEPIETDGDVLAYTRRSRRDESAFLVALNLGPREHTLKLPRPVARGIVALSTHPQRAGDVVTDELHLLADEGIVVRLARG